MEKTLEERVVYLEEQLNMVYKGLSDMKKITEEIVNSSDIISKDISDLSNLIKEHNKIADRFMELHKNNIKTY